MELKTDKMIAEVDAGIGWVTYNNPARHNAVSLEMWEAQGAILESFQNDGEVRVVVLRGAGGKAFVSGADISEFESKRATARRSSTGRSAMNGTRKPVTTRFNSPVWIMLAEVSRSMRMLRASSTSWVSTVPR